MTDSSESDPDSPAAFAEILTTFEHSNIDHSYGKSPVVFYNVSDEENIRAIASDLEETTSNVGTYLNNVCTAIWH